MDKSNVSKPITTTLTGSNYNLWAQEMKNFLISRKLWHVVTGDITKPTKAKKETNAKFAHRLEDWESKNHEIITWFRNTSISSIHVQYADYDSAKEIWDFLASHFQATGLAQYYQLWYTLVNLKQESGQSVNDLLAQVEPIWNQICQAKISEDHLYLIQILRALGPEYEAIRTSLLHRRPFPSLDTAIREITFEETRLNMDKDPQCDTALATTKSSRQKSNNQLCKNCNQIGHSFSTCPTVECRYCHGFGHILKQCPMRSQSLKGGFSKSKTVPKVGSSSTAAAMESPTTITLSDLEAILKQVISSNTSSPMSASSSTSTAMSTSSNTSTAMSAASGNMRLNVPLSRVQSSLLVDEVVVEILSRVPVKSLLRFRCVCKSWKSLISDPKLVKLHLQRSMARNADFTHLRLLFECEPDENFDQMYASSCSVNKFLEKPSSVIDEPPYRYGLMFHRVIGSCNGLICLMGTVFDFSNHQDRFWVRLWNPATRTRSQESSSFYHRGFNSFGFGYDDLSNTYKAVVVLFSASAKKHSQRNQVKVFTIGGNSWREIQCFPAVLTTRIQEPVYLNGTLNWVALNVNSVNRVGWKHTSITLDQVIIVSLHLGMETYTQLALPRDIDEVSHSEPILGVLRDFLCVSHDHRRTHFVIWQMKEFGVEGSWTRLVKVSYEYLYSGYSEYHSVPVVLCMSVSGDVLMLSYSDGRFQAILYNPEGSRLRRLTIPASMYIESAKYYVESLVWPC